MSHKDYGLGEILKKNPFTLTLIKQWERDLKSFFNGQTRFSRLCFILDSDRDSIREYEKRHETSDKKHLHLELLPQPFQGNPRAPIWILLLNPGYSDVDRYDHLGLCPSCNKNLAIVKANTPHDVFDHNRNKGRALLKRQKILLRQLRLKMVAFSLLDNAFNTLKHAYGRDLGGGYRWWKKVFFGHKDSTAFLLHEFRQEISLAKVLGKKIFVLEYSPYHSSSVNSSILEISNAYRRFWEELIVWGVKSRRKFIVRGKYMDGVLERLKVNRSNSVRFQSDRNVALTQANLKGDRAVKAAIINCLKAR